MNNVQLYIAVAIPSVLVILGWLSNNTRLAAVEKRIDAMESKIDRLEAKMDRRFDGVLDGIGSLRERVAVVESKQG